VRIRRLTGWRRDPNPICWCCEAATRAARGQTAPTRRTIPVTLELEERKFGTHELLLGMFVCRLDRPWEGTPFGLQGFLLKTPEQIRALSELCSHVYVDVLRSVDMSPARTVAAPPPKPRPTIWPVRRVHYSDTVALTDEVPLARAAQQNAEQLAGKILDDVRAGRKLSAQDINDAVEPIVKSVLRSADAFFWINSLRKRDAYAYSHAINCSALAAAFGRHMGFPEDALIDLATGGLLLDVGKAELPEELLAHPGALSDEQFREVRRHVQHGLRILGESGIRSERVTQMVRTHHERYDGSGYPERLSEAQIPLFGRMAAVIDSFDAMTSDRAHSRALSRHEVLQQLYRWSDKMYQREIVEQLTQCLGVYPTGSLVELNTGEVAIVMAQNRARSLRPRVIVLTGADKKLDSHFRTVDLMAQAEGEAKEKAIYIVRTLDPGSYGLDPTELYL
jgi:HD-GYP domain-containing protein (c-di-GMP phosphodiesterase class II)